MTVEDGRRVVRQSIVGSDGLPFVFQHDYPNALEHHYRPSGVGEDVLLYDGPFQRANDADPFNGSVRWRWSDRPRIEATGTRSTTPTALQQFFDGATGVSMWVDPDILILDLLNDRLPPQPDSARPLAKNGHTVTLRVEQQIGDGRNLERVTFLVPNGWQASDGLQVCDPDNLVQLWRGRLTATGHGWTVTIDRTGEMNTEAWRELTGTGRSRFTHVGCLTRVDGSTFCGEQAFQALDRVRLGLNLALGRRTTCSLPVGWRGDAPVWGRWRSAPIDPPRPVSHWLDEPIAARQVSKVIELVLDFTIDALAYETLRTAVAYYVAANMDVDVELSVAVPMSGLQLLAYYRFVTSGTYSRSQWKDLTTEEQLRMLLTDINADLAVSPHFRHLDAVQARLASNAPPRDALGVVIKMRNVVTHPARDTPRTFSPYEWAEAGMHTRYWLCLALLHLVGYNDEIAAVMEAAPRWAGQRRPAPWAATNP